MVMDASQIQLIVGVAVVLVLALVMRRRMQRPQTLKITWLWVRPAILGVIITAFFITLPHPSTPLAIAALAGASVLGGGLGWLRAQSLKLDVHPETGDLTQQTSPLGAVLILLVVLARLGLRQMAAGGQASWLLAEGLLLFGGALVVASSLTTWLRARALLASRV